MWLGPFGAMINLKAPVRDIAAPSVKANSTLTLLSGQVRAQRAPSGSRTWTLVWPFIGADTLRQLVALEQGVLGPAPWWFYDPFVARSNMLPAAAAVPGLEGDWTQLDGSGTAYALAGPAQVLPDGMPVLASVIVAGTWELPVSGTDRLFLPTIAGQLYGFALYAVGSAGATVELAMDWCDATQTVTSTDSSTTTLAATSVPQRVFVAGVAPGAGVSLRVLTASAAVFALQLCELPAPDGSFSYDDAYSYDDPITYDGTPEPIGWFPGEQMPLVTAAGLDQVYNTLLADGDQARTLTLTLTEVGGTA